MRIAQRGTAVIVLAAALASGCTYSLPIGRNPPLLDRPAAKLSVKVGLLIDPETKAKKAESRLGDLRFVYPIGEALEASALQTLPLIFSGIERVRSSRPLSPALDGTLQLLIEDAYFAIPSLFGPGIHVVSSTILLKCVVYDKDGKTVASYLSRGYARSLIRYSILPGRILKSSMGPTADQALQRAMGGLVRKLLEDKKIRHLNPLPTGLSKKN